MGPSAIGAALAFIAFGANLIGTGVLLLFNPRDRVLRWYAVFSMLMLAWLALQGTMMMALAGADVLWWYGLVVHLMPIAFMVVSLVQVYGIKDQTAAAILLAATAFLVGVIGNPLEWKQQMLWHATGWGAGAVLYVIRGRRNRATEPTADGPRFLDITLNLLVPVGVIGAILMREKFIIIALPLLTITTVFLLFLGIVYHRYYNIEVRAVRSGEIGARAAEHERLALLGEMSASIAHEVRNPLTGMRSLAQRLRDEPLDDEKRGRYLGVILDEIGRLERIVTNLLDVAKRTVPRAKGEIVDLATLFADLELLVEARARQADVRLSCRAGSLRASAAREPLAQVLLNLLLNAIAHAPAGTRVDLHAEPAGNDVAVVVRDQGAGIPADERDRIFEPFHTSGGGTGLGLAVVRTLARDHQWKIEVHDGPGGGAELRLLIPATDQT